MLAQILVNTPAYVWVIFAALLVLGLVQTRSRMRSRPWLVFPAVGFVALSFYGVWSNFAGTATGVWAIGLAAGVALARIGLGRPAATFDPATARFAVPGSWLPLVVMLAIFGIDYAIGIVRAVNPAAATSHDFVTVASAALGLSSGLLAGRMLAILRSARPARRAA